MVSSSATKATAVRVGGGSVDVIVVGGGPAGLSAAKILARSRRSVLVVDAGTPRNAPAAGVHNYLYAEGTAPAELAATGRGEARAYGVEVVDGAATTASVLTDPEPGSPRFTVQVRTRDGASRTVRARRVVLATGLVDVLPDVAGLAARWGRDVLHCPFCHGWEVRDRAVGVLGTHPMALHQVMLFRRLTDDVVYFQHTAPDPTDEQVEQLTALGIGWVVGEVAAVVTDDDQLTGVRMADGRVVPRQAVAVATGLEARRDLLTDLGLTVTDLEIGGALVGHHLPADPSGLTATAGVWAAGNVTALMAQVVTAAAAGSAVGAAVHMDLMGEDTRVAVTAFRSRRNAVATVRVSAAEAFWEPHYAASPAGIGGPNPVLLDSVSPLRPGPALDLGCGGGGDALWLAQQGWKVLTVDVSATALARVVDRAAGAGMSDRIGAERHDLTATFPTGDFDLVSAQYLLSPVEFDRPPVFARAAAAVRVGGMLLVVDHASVAPWSWADPDTVFPTPRQTLDSIGLDPDLWQIVQLQNLDRVASGPDGQSATVTDTVIALSRIG